MAVLRVNKTSNYTVMSNYHFREKGMSLKAKGLLSLMLSLPDDWDYSINGLVAICKENETAIKSTLNELKKFGYLEVTKLLPNETPHGRIDYVYNIYEQSIFLQQGSEKQGVESLGVETQKVGNQGQLNTNKSITNKVNNKNKDIYDKPHGGTSSNNSTLSFNEFIKKKNENRENHELTKALINRNFISDVDLDIYKYNELFEEVLGRYDYVDVCKCINYIIARAKDNKDIDDQFNYFKTSLLNNLEKLEYQQEAAGNPDNWLNW